VLQFKSKHFLTGEELSHGELISLIEAAEQLKKFRGQTETLTLQNTSDKKQVPEKVRVLENKTVALIFEKPSLRTRVSFTVGIEELGGQVIELAGSQKKHEDPEDAIRVLQGMVHGVMLRTFEHETLERMVSKSKIPIINGLSNSHHPCQALADLQTLYQRFGRLNGLKLAYIGDGNNVLHSLLLMMPFAGVDVHYSCPKGYEPDEEILRRAQRRAKEGGASITKFDSPKESVADVDAIYTDVWTSMGFESENAKRVKDFEGFQINSDLLALAKPTAIVLHCLPMNKGFEITQDVVDSPQAALFEQAENRLHAQKALMIGLYNGLN
jgi:ornithine carbamoyltransferase